MTECAEMGRCFVNILELRGCFLSGRIERDSCCGSGALKSGFVCWRLVFRERLFKLVGCGNGWSLNGDELSMLLKLGEGVDSNRVFE